MPEPRIGSLVALQWPCKGKYVLGKFIQYDEDDSCGERYKIKFEDKTAYCNSSLSFWFHRKEFVELNCSIGEKKHATI